MTLLLVTMAGEPEGPLVIGTLQSAGRISVRTAFAIVRIWNAPGVSGTRARRQGHDPNAYYIPTRGTNDAAPRGGRAILLPCGQKICGDGSPGDRRPRTGNVTSRAGPRRLPPSPGARPFLSSTS
jgi:hypothetical protein